METSLAGTGPAYYPVSLCRHGAAKGKESKGRMGSARYRDTSPALVCVLALHSLEISRRRIKPKSCFGRPGELITP